MKGEIRGLLAGTYFSDNETVLEIIPSDDGNRLIFTDLDLEISIEWVIDENGNIVRHEMDYPVEPENEGF